MVTGETSTRAWASIAPKPHQILTTLVRTPFPNCSLHPIRASLAHSALLSPCAPYCRRAARHLNNSPALHCHTRPHPTQNFHMQPTSAISPGVLSPTRGTFSEPGVLLLSLNPGYFFRGQFPGIPVDKRQVDSPREGLLTD